MASSAYKYAQARARAQASQAEQTQPVEPQTPQSNPFQAMNDFFGIQPQAPQPWETPTGYGVPLTPEEKLMMAQTGGAMAGAMFSGGNPLGGAAGYALHPRARYPTFTCGLHVDR